MYNSNINFKYSYVHFKIHSNCPSLCEVEAVLEGCDSFHKFTSFGGNISKIKYKCLNRA